MKKSAVIAFVACLAFILAIATPAHATNILTNPGFETGTLSPWAVGTNGCGASPWCAPWGVSTAAAHSGTYGAVDVGNIQLTQTFTGVTTSSITGVSFWVEHPAVPDQSPTVSLMVTFGYTNSTTQSFSLSTSNASWNLEDVTADLAAGLTLDSISVSGYAPNLNIIAEGDASQAFTFLDDFDIEVAGSGPSATPEPGALLLLGSGLIGAAGMLRKRLKSAE